MLLCIVELATEQKTWRDQALNHNKDLLQWKEAELKQTLTVFGSTFPGKHAVSLCVECCSELTQKKTSAKLDQYKKAIKQNLGFMDARHVVGFLFLFCPLLPFSVQLLPIFPRMQATPHFCYKINRSSELLVSCPKHILNRNIFTEWAVTYVETHLEDLQQFAHDLFHLHVIKP